jgi:hypothetical protein
MTVEVFYTGGGIWLAEMNLDNKRYAVIDSSYKECLTIYNYVDEDNKYMCEDMIFSDNVANLDTEHKKIYYKLLKALNSKISKFSH